MKRYSIVNNDYQFQDVLKSTITKPCYNNFNLAMLDYLNSTESSCLLTSCGFTALWLILKNIKEINSSRDEVIIPSYTAPGLVLPIRKLGLKIRYCELSHDTFSIDIKSVENSINKNTLAIIAVHMFGIPCKVDRIIQLDKNITVIEDCAQSLGAKIYDKPVGTLAELSFGSFGRGKNFSLYGGGYLLINKLNHVSDRITKDYEMMPKTTCKTNLINLLKYFVFSAITSPSIYAHTSTLLKLFKSTKEQTGFSAKKYGNEFEGIYSSIFKIWQKKYASRNINGNKIIKALENISYLTLPKPDENTFPVYNRLPVLVNNSSIKEKLIKKLCSSGIEPSSMYGKAVNDIWPGDNNQTSKESKIFATNLLTLPVYAHIGDKEIELIKKCFEETY